MAIELDVLRDGDLVGVPDDAAFRAWANAAAPEPPVSVAIRVVDEAEGRRLNRAYRGKDRPTNVLSFPAALPPEVAGALPAPPLGDLVLCAPVVAREARSQGKPEAHHWAHLVVHGLLHLQGWDHEEDAAAQRMERREVELLEGLGIANPYATEGAATG